MPGPAAESIEASPKAGEADGLRPEDLPTAGAEDVPAAEDDRALARMIGCAALLGLGLWVGLILLLL